MTDFEKDLEIAMLRARIKARKATAFLYIPFAIALLVVSPIALGALFGETLATFSLVFGFVIMTPITIITGFYIEDLPEDIGLLAYYESEQ